jgi:hypothetical protein
MAKESEKSYGLDGSDDGYVPTWAPYTKFPNTAVMNLHNKRFSNVAFKGVAASGEVIIDGGMEVPITKSGWTQTKSGSAMKNRDLKTLGSTFNMGVYKADLNAPLGIKDQTTRNRIFGGVAKQTTTPKDGCYDCENDGAEAFLERSSGTVTTPAEIPERLERASYPAVDYSEGNLNLVPRKQNWMVMQRMISATSMQVRDEDKPMWKKLWADAAVSAAGNKYVNIHGFFVHSWADQFHKVTSYSSSGYITITPPLQY